MSYGAYGYEGENKADKGKKAGSCNVTRCQRPGAVWYNRGTYAYYCGSCARRINEIPPCDHAANGPLCKLDETAVDELAENC